MATTSKSLIEETGPSLTTAPQDRRKRPPITCEQFKNMVSVFYGDQSSPEEREGVNRALMDLYKLNEAWCICVEVIETCSATEHLMLFVAARTLRVKMVTYFDELVESEYPNLFDFLIRAMKNTTHKPSKTQLADCLMLLYIRMFERVPDLLGALAKNFPDNNSDNLSIILEILESLPEMVVDEKVVIADSLREKALNHLVVFLQPKVFETLEQIVINHPDLDPKCRLHVLKCFDHWIINKSSDQMKGVFAKTELFKMCFEELHNPVRLHQEEAAEVIISILRLCHDVDKHPDVYQKALEYINSFKRVAHPDIAKDMMKPILFVYESLFRKIFLKPFVDPQSPVIVYILYDVILECYKKPSLGLVSPACLALQKIFDKLGSRESLLSLGENMPALRQSDILEKSISSTELRFIATNKNLFKSILETAITEHARLTAEMIGMYDKPDVDFYMLEEECPELENKTILRAELVEMIFLMSRTLGFLEVFGILRGPFEELQQHISDTSKPKDNHTFSCVESILFCYLATIPSSKHAADPNISSLVRGVLQFVLELNLPTFKLNLAIVSIIRESAPFYSGNSDLLKLTVDYLVKLMKSERKFEKESAEAMCQLCKYNPEFIHHNLAIFMEMYPSLCHQDAIVVGYVSAVNRIDNQDRDNKQGLVNIICKPFADKLRQVAELMEGIDPEGAKMLDPFSAELMREKNAFIILNSVSSLTLIVQNLDNFKEGSRDGDFHVLTQVLVQLWPVLETILRHSFELAKVVENCCQLIKHVMRTMGKLFEPFLDSYFELAKSNYSKKPISTYLYTVENALTIFHQTPQQSVKLQSMFTHMVGTTYQNIIRSEEREEKIDPDLFDDFFGLITRFLRIRPDIPLSNPSALENQCFLALKYIRHSNSSVVKSILSFFEECFKLGVPSNPPNPLEQIVYQCEYGSKVLMQVIYLLLEDYPTSKSFREFILSTLMSLFLYHRKTCIPWVMQALQQVPNSVLNGQEKQELVELLLGDTANEPARVLLVEFIQKFFTRCLSLHKMR